MVCYNMGTETQRAKGNGILATMKGWAKEMTIGTTEKCCQENEYGRLQAEYQTAVDAYSASLLYAIMIKEVEGKVSDEIEREVHEARRNMGWARYKLNAYRRKHIIPEDWNCR